MELEIRVRCFGRDSGRRGVFSVLLTLTLAMVLLAGLGACGKKAPPEPLDSVLHLDRTLGLDPQIERAKL